MTDNNYSPNGCTIIQTEYCGYRLPCGYCTALGRPCPMQGNQIYTEPAWKLPEITCSTKEGNECKN